MKNFIGILAVLALVVTTTVPIMSHAMPHDSANAVQTTKTEPAKSHDCPGHGEAKADSQKTVQNDKDSSDKCCDKGICKCVGGTCHSGLSQFLGNGSNSLLTFISSQSRFGSTNESADSAFLEGLKRPPRA